jgi:gas vesicle protein
LGAADPKGRIMKGALAMASEKIRPKKIQEKIAKLFQLAELDKERIEDMSIIEKRLYECHFDTIIEACDRYDGNLSSWKTYIQENIIPDVKRIMEELKEEIIVELRSD